MAHINSLYARAVVAEEGLQLSAAADFRLCALGIAPRKSTQAEACATSGTGIPLLLSGRGFVVVLLFVNLFTGCVLLLVDALFFGWSKLSAVGLAVCSHICVNSLFGFLGLRGFTGGHLSAADAVGNPLLLQIAPCAYFVVTVGVGRAVVFVVINGFAQVVLLLIDLPTFLRRQCAAVCRPVGANLALFTFASRFSRFLVSPGVSCPEATPLAMRPC